MMTAALVLSGCAGHLALQQAPPSPSKPKPVGSPVASPAPAGSRPSIAVVEPGNYTAALKQHENALIRSLGSGALTSDNVDYYMEVEEADLRRRLSAGKQINITRKDQNIIIGPIGRAFSSGSAQIGDKLRASLNIVAPVFREFTKTLVIIHAYTDESGPTEYNRKLSMQRAAAVAHYLFKAGVSSGRLLAVGFGESGHDGSDGTAKELAKNRHIAIELTPLVR